MQPKPGVTTDPDLIEFLEEDLSSGNGDFEDVEHLVGDFRSGLYQLTGLNPRALCGVKLTMSPSAPFPTATARTCRKCRDIAGWPG